MKKEEKEISFDRGFYEKILKGAKTCTIRTNPKTIGVHKVHGQDFSIEILEVKKLSKDHIGWKDVDGINLLSFWHKCGFDSMQEAQDYYENYLDDECYMHRFVVV